MRCGVVLSLTIYCQAMHDRALQWGRARAWAEASLLAAERTLAQAFGRSRPSWLNASYYTSAMSHVMQPSA